jgi:hypothetical protein
LGLHLKCGVYNISILRICTILLAEFGGKQKIEGQIFILYPGSRKATAFGRPVPTSDGGCRPTGALFRNFGLYPWGSTIGKLLGEKYHLSQNRIAPTYNRAFSAGRRLLYQSVIGSLSD